MNIERENTMTRTTTQAVTATLRAAGFASAILTRRERRSGYAVRKMGRQVAIMWNDHDGHGDIADQFARVREALKAAGFVEVYVNERGACVRVTL
jgi:hypothetical protein